jgi:hypothetical protein
MIVIFTGADDLEKNEKSLEKALSDIPEDLAQVMDDCSRRAVAFNNVAKNKSPYVKNLLQEVDGMLKMNGGQYYECPKYAGVSNDMKEEVERRLRRVEGELLSRNKHVQQIKSETLALQGMQQRLQEHQKCSEANVDARRRFDRVIQDLKDCIAREPRPLSFLQKSAGTVKSIVASIVGRK